MLELYEERTSRKRFQILTCFHLPLRTLSDAWMKSRQEFLDVRDQMQQQFSL